MITSRNSTHLDDQKTSRDPVSLLGSSIFNQFVHQLLNSRERSNQQTRGTGCYSIDHEYTSIVFRGHNGNDVMPGYEQAGMLKTVFMNES